MLPTTVYRTAAVPRESFPALSFQLTRYFPGFIAQTTDRNTLLLAHDVCNLSPLCLSYSSLHTDYSTQNAQKVAERLQAHLYCFTVERLFRAILLLGEGTPLSFRAARTILVPRAWMLPIAELEKSCSQEEQLKESFPTPSTAFYNSA